MKSATAGLSEQIADAASDIGSVAQEQAKRGLRHAQADMGSVAADDRLGVAAGAARLQASSLADTLEDMVRDRPLSAVVLALGLGFLIGAVWRR